MSGLKRMVYVVVVTSGTRGCYNVETNDYSCWKSSSSSSPDNPVLNTRRGRLRVEAVVAAGFRCFLHARVPHGFTHTDPFTRVRAIIELCVSRTQASGAYGLLSSLLPGSPSLQVKQASACVVS